MSDYNLSHDSIESEDIEGLLALLRAGADIEDEMNGFTLLQHAIDVEVANYRDDGELHVDMTALLLAMGADPQRRSEGGSGASAESFALEMGHKWATILIDAWIRDHSTNR
jgi:hypothetical protein